MMNKTTKSNVFRAAVGLFCVCLLSACGQKGALYLPDATTPPSHGTPADLSQQTIDNPTSY